MTLKELREALAKEGLDPKFADVIESQAQPCLRFDAIPTGESELPPGCSKLGGSPDLPRGVSWPSDDERLLDFLCQIDLQDLKPYPFCKVLPSEGHLYFFLNAGKQPEGFDPYDTRNWQVIFHPGPSDELENRVRPTLGLNQAHYKPCRITFHQALSPGWHEIPLEAWHLNDDQIDEFRHFIERLPEHKAHQVLGRPGRIMDLEYPMQLECQFMSLGLFVGKDGKFIDEARAKEVEPGAANWRLLLQLDSDSGAGMDWEDCMVSFWIRAKDIQTRKFSEAWMIVEYF
jgi:uncharacterized protein YwqG